MPEREEKDAEDAAGNGCRPKEFGRDSGIDEIEIQHGKDKREADQGQNNGNDVKRNFDFHGKSISSRARQCAELCAHLKWLTDSGSS